MIDYLFEHWLASTVFGRLGHLQLISFGEESIEDDIVVILRDEST
jgi:hypothetical protein